MAKQTRDIVLATRLTTDEARAARRLADAAGVSVAEWMHLSVVAAIREATTMHAATAATVVRDLVGANT